jgi:transcriptional regulator with PAS, ATPase and Fis domain
LSKIAFISPDKDLFLKGKKIVHELGLENKVDFYLARLKRAIRLAQSLQNTDVDVIVSRGGTAQLIIESHVNIPVVEIMITGQDLAQVFYEAKKITKLPHPKVTMQAFSNMIYDIEILSNILGIELTIHSLEKTEDIPMKMATITPSDTDVVVGGIRTATLAKTKGFKTLLIHSSDFSLRSAFIEARKIALARKIEKQRTQEIKALIDYSLEGIISVNRQKIIRILNPTAEHLLNCSAQKSLGQKISSILPSVNLDNCLLDGQELIGQVIQLGRHWLTLNIAPIVVDEIIIGAMITFQDITRIQEMEIKIRNEVLARKFVAKYHFTDILGISDQIIETKRAAQEIAAVDANVLISGESGTGKELFAQSIHNASLRKSGPFVAVNCAALPANLLESELFGYVDGAFTGARKKGKPGLFEMAHRGTIFLDEISEMDKYGQSRLLRVLQEKQVMRLGDDKYIPIDVRIIAATNKNLMKLVKQEQFRQDLFYRLKVLTIKISPLRNRTGDIDFLAHHFLNHYTQKHHKEREISLPAYKYLSQYSWPGNVRELMFFIERLVVIAKETVISAETIGKYWDDNEDLSEQPPFAVVSPDLSEEQKIRAALIECHSNITHAAQQLDMDRSTLYRKLKFYKIELKKIYE